MLTRRRRKVFDELRRVVQRGRTMPTGHCAFFFMHMYAYRMRVAGGWTRNGTEQRPPVARGRI